MHTEIFQVRASSLRWRCFETVEIEAFTSFWEAKLKLHRLNLMLLSVFVEALIVKSSYFLTPRLIYVGVFERLFPGK